jgi:hypothetical protein
MKIGFEWGKAYFSLDSAKRAARRLIAAREKNGQTEGYVLVAEVDTPCGIEYVLYIAEV